MRYMLLIYVDEAGYANASGDAPATMNEEYMAFGRAVTEEGILRSGDALQPSATATMVRVREGETLLSDGPFAETHEQLGGFYVVECGTLDEAIVAAKRIPGAQHGAVEVRPIVEFA